MPEPRLSEQQAKQIEAAKRLIEDFDRVAATEYGLRVLKYIKSITAYGESNIQHNPQTKEINVIQMAFYEGQQAIWAKGIRPLLNRDKLIEIEIPDRRIDQTIVSDEELEQWATTGAIQLP